MDRDSSSKIQATPTSIQVNDPPRFYQVEHFAIRLTNPISIDSMKDFFSNSILLKLPRFHSLLVKEDNRKQYWRPTKVDIDHHFIVIPDVEEDDAEDAINGYLAELASAPPMSSEKPLWEIHVLLQLKCLVLRVHHALGDGTSLASLLNEIGCSATGEATEGRSNNSISRSRGGVWSSLVLCAQFAVRFFLVGDKKTVLRGGGKYVQNRPQKMATARFSLQDINLVKKAIANATINDVLCGIIWGGFLKYINAESSIGLNEGQQITGMVMANLRQRPGLLEVSKLIEENILESYWGNKFGVFLLPFYYTTKIQNPLDYVRKAKFTLDRKKQSMEPHFAINLRNLVLRLCGVKIVSYLNQRGWSNMTFGISNVVGPANQMSFDGNPINLLKFSLSASSLGILMSLISYNNNLELQILTAEDVISDPKILANCFKNTFEEMKDVVNHQSSQATD